MKFILDTNIFIQAHRLYYAFDICPGFWNCLLHHCNDGSLASIDRVMEEIKDGGDQLWDWAKEIPKNMFLPTGAQDVGEEYARIMHWVNDQDFTPSANSDFARKADGWLVAYAKINNMEIVTDEVWHENIKRRVPIPNVCKEFGVSYQNTFSMLRELQVQFVL